jgi:hypothetical protein
LQCEDREIDNRDNDDSERHRPTYFQRSASKHTPTLFGIELMTCFMLMLG